MRLVVLAPTEPVVGGRRDEACGRHRGGEHGEEVDVALDAVEPAVALGEWHREQEGEQDLDPRQPDPELVEQLDELAVVPGRGILRRCSRRGAGVTVPVTPGSARRGAEVGHPEIVRPRTRRRKAVRPSTASRPG